MNEQEPVYELVVIYRIGAEEQRANYHFFQESQRNVALAELQHAMELIRIREKADNDYQAGIW